MESGILIEQGQRLKEVRQALSLTQSEFADKLGVGDKGTVSKYEVGRLQIAKKAEVELFTTLNVNKQWFETGKGSMFIPAKKAGGKTPGQQIRDNKAFGDKEKKGIIHVPLAAQANYQTYYLDPVYKEQVERLYIPGVNFDGDSYRSWEMKGDSMEFINAAGQPSGIMEGNILITEFVEPRDWHQIVQYYIYVIVTEDRIMVKRLFKLPDQDAYAAISDNEHYQQFKIVRREIKELWLVKRKLDWWMPPPKKIDITVT